MDSGLTESLREVLSLNFRCFLLTVLSAYSVFISVSALARLRSDIFKDWNNSSTHIHTRMHSTAPCGSISTGGRGGEFPFKVPYELTLEPPTVTSLREDGLNIKRNNSSLEVQRHK